MSTDNVFLLAAKIIIADRTSMRRQIRKAIGKVSINEVDESKE